MNPLQLIKVEQDILKQKVEDAIAFFEEKTGLQIDSLYTVIMRENHACGIFKSRKIEITYQELKEAL